MTPNCGRPDFVTEEAGEKEVQEEAEEEVEEEMGSIQRVTGRQTLPLALV